MARDQIADNRTRRRSGVVSSSAPGVRTSIPTTARERPLEPRPSGVSVIEFQGVSKKYSSGDVGLDDVSFSVEREDFVFLVGSTGSGKSTVMRLLIKELEPTKGTIRVANHNLRDIGRKRIPYYRRNVGVVFQDFKLLPNRTGTTVLVATHDQAMVDKMRRRVLELSHGRIVRDEAAGAYTRDENTREFARRLRAPNERPPGV